MRRIFTALIFVMISMSSFAEIASGTCGDKLTWSLSDDYTLTIDGEGDMTDFNGSSAWYPYREQIIKLTIGNKVTSIGNYAFFYCSKLTSVTIPNSVTSIGEWAFANCSSLISINIPSSVTSIGKCAFSYCRGLTSVTIGNSVTSIGKWAFLTGSLQLTTVTCLAENVPSTDTYAFQNNRSNLTLIVPKASLQAYKSTAPWSEFGTIKALISNKCATPSIAYDNGQLVYSTDTEGATVVSQISDNDINTFNSLRVTLSATYNISAYATKSGYEDSNIANATLHWMNGTLDTTTGAKEFGAKRAVLVSSNDGFVNISGLNDGEKIEAFTTDGKHITTTYAAGNAVNIAAKSGEALILKIGDETIKTMVK